MCLEVQLFGKFGVSQRCRNTFVDENMIVSQNFHMAQSNTIHASMALMGLITKYVGYRSAKNQLPVDAKFDKYVLHHIGDVNNQFLSP